MKGQRDFKLKISPRWKIHPTFHISLLEPYRTSVREGREQPSREPEEIHGDLEWEVERIVKSEIISYTRKVCGRNKRMRELRYFVKWKGCSEDENTWKPPESLENAQELVEGFHQENQDMPSRAYVEYGRKVFLVWTSKRMRFFTLLPGVQKRILFVLRNNRRKIL